MDMKEVFINRIYQQVGVDGVDNLISILTSPPGRKPKKELVELSEYFNKQPDKEKEILRKIIELSINSAIFDILCIFDKVNKLDNCIDDIKLSILKNNQEILLNDTKSQDLHDLFNIEIGNIS